MPPKKPSAKSSPEPSNTQQSNPAPESIKPETAASEQETAPVSVAAMADATPQTSDKDSVPKKEAGDANPLEVVEEEFEEEVEEEFEEEFEEEVDDEEDPEDAAAMVVPEPVKEKRKQREFEVFVGGLPRDATEEDVENVFKKVGEVVEVRLAKNPISKKNKGFAFVRFSTVEQAKRATIVLRRTEVKGKSCGVIRSNDNETLHVGNICITWTKDDLMEKLKAFELENLDEVHLIEDPRNKGKNRGYAFLDFCTHMDAVAACSKLQKRDVFFGTDVRAEVSFSKTVEPDEEVMAQVRSVFVDGLLATWDEAHVREQFKRFGEIESVQLACNMLTAKRKDFGFICFRTRQAALDCIEKVNKDGVGEGTEKVKVTATLKKPLQRRTPPMLGVRGGYIDRNFGMRGQQPYGFGRPFTGKTARSRELPGNGMGNRSRGRSRFSSGRYGARAAISTPTGKFGARVRREYARDEPGSRISRDPYLEDRSTHRRARESYQDFSYPYSHRRGPYSDEMYDPQFEDHEAYEYPAVSGYKRSYSELDHDVLASSSLTRRGRSRTSLEMGTYPQIGGRYTEYSSRLLPDERVGYDRMEFAGRDYGGRYLSGSDAYRSYY